MGDTLNTKNKQLFFGALSWQIEDVETIRTQNEKAIQQLAGDLASFGWSHDTTSRALTKALLDEHEGFQRLFNI